MIKLEHVDKYFGDLHVLKDVNLEVAEGEKLVIIGPSGSGKSTTVRCMNFLEEPTSGHVYINGEELTNKNKTRVVRENISMVFPDTPSRHPWASLPTAPSPARYDPATDAPRRYYGRCSR